MPAFKHTMTCLEATIAGLMAKGHCVAGRTYPVTHVQKEYWEVAGRTFQTEEDAEAFARQKRSEAGELEAKANYLGFIKNKLRELGLPWTGEACAGIMVNYLDEYVDSIGMALVPQTKGTWNGVERRSRNLARTGRKSKAVKRKR